MEEQPPKEAEETIKTTKHSIDTGGRRDPGAEAEQQKPEEGGPREPE